jgi:Lrp/AsnC family leucine-responsive transcriptional regulator
VDAIDLRLLDLLRLNARVSGAELARQVGLSPPAVHERVAKLEQSKIIRGYRADISPEAVGLGITAIVGVVPAGRADGAALVAAMSEIAEIDTCLFVAGEESYMLQVRVASMGDLERLIVRLGNLPGVERTRTTIALSVKWEDRPPPAPAPRRRATDRADGDDRRATDRVDGDGRPATDRVDGDGRRASAPAGRDDRR